MVQMTHKRRRPLDEAEAVGIAQAFLKQNVPHSLNLHGARLAEGGRIWRVMFIYTDFRPIDPDRVIVEVNAETGRASLFPVL